MPCYSPLRAFQHPDGRIQVVKSAAVFNFSLPCGRCIGCRLKYSQMWAIRCVHEASLHDLNCCVTLTYREEDLPRNGSLVYRDVQLFMKRFRKFIAPNKVRFFCGGEYGSKTARPHYHMMIFNYDFPDKVVYKERQGVAVNWTSAIANRLWKLGDVVVGVADFNSAAYIARYVCDKVYGDLAADHYRFVDFSTGECADLTPEFAHMSNRPGIGAAWLRKYWKDVVQDLQCVHQGKKVSIPRTYVKYVSQLADVEDVQRELKRRMQKLWRDNTPQRLRDKARVAAARLGLSRRVL